MLFGHGHIDRQQFDKLGQITRWLETLARAWGGLGGVGGLWQAITGAAVPTGFVRRADAGLAGFADHARRRLARACQKLDGSRTLVIELAEGRVPDIVIHVIERRLTVADAVALERLRKGLDNISAPGRWG